MDAGGRYWGVREVQLQLVGSQTGLGDLCEQVGRALPTTLPACYHPFSGNDPSLAWLWYSQILFLSIGQRHQLSWASGQILSSLPSSPASKVGENSGNHGATKAPSALRGLQPGHPPPGVMDSSVKGGAICPPVASSSQLVSPPASAHNGSQLPSL